MPDTDCSTSTEIREQEAWLSLAASENQRHNWRLSPPELAQLICAAAPNLAHAASLLDARAALWFAWLHRKDNR